MRIEPRILEIKAAEKRSLLSKAGANLSRLDGQQRETLAALGAQGRKFREVAARVIKSLEQQRPAGAGSKVTDGLLRSLAEEKAKREALAAKSAKLGSQRSQAAGVYIGAKESLERIHAEQAQMRTALKLRGQARLEEELSDTLCAVKLVFRQPGSVSGGERAVLPPVTPGACLTSGVASASQASASRENTAHSPASSQSLAGISDLHCQDSASSARVQFAFTADSGRTVQVALEGNKNLGVSIALSSDGRGRESDMSYARTQIMRELRKGGIRVRSGLINTRHVAGTTTIPLLGRPWMVGSSAKIQDFRGWSDARHAPLSRGPSLERLINGQEPIYEMTSRLLDPVRSHRLAPPGVWEGSN